MKKHNKLIKTEIKIYSGNTEALKTMYKNSKMQISIK